MRILLDGMGGDYAPVEIVKGAVAAAREIDDTIAILGPEDRIRECLENEGWQGDNIEVINCTEVITNDEAEEGFDYIEGNDPYEGWGSGCFHICRFYGSSSFRRTSFARKNKGNKETCNSSFLP